MGPIVLLAITIIGLLIMIGDIPYQRVGGILVVIIDAGIFLPMVFPPVLLDGGSPWWEDI